MKTLRKSNVYCVPAELNVKNRAEAMRYILEHRKFKLFQAFWQKQLVGIHVSCPEEGVLRDDLLGFIKSAGESLKKSDVCAFICDTSNRHRKISSNALEQMTDACFGCFENLRDTLPLFMLDGINGNHEYIYKTRRMKDELYLGGEIPNLDGLVMFSVPGKHSLCGISGALYSTGTCLASKRGKTRQYSQDKPQVDRKKCYGCKRCLHSCPVKAISMKGRHAAIDYEKCIDCGKCVEIARHCGISYVWNASPEYFTRHMIDYAAAAGDVLKGKIIYVNILPDSTGCGNNGVLIARDPVAIDAATADLLAPDKAFSPEDKDAYSTHIEAAASGGIGNRDYELVKIAY